MGLFGDIFGGSLGNILDIALPALTGIIGASQPTPSGGQFAQPTNVAKQAAGTEYGTVGNFGAGELKTGSTLPQLLSMLGYTAGLPASSMTNLFGSMPGNYGATSPYALSANQQQLLNQQVDNYNMQRKDAIGQYHAQMERSGITDPEALSAGEQYLNQQFDGMVNNLQSTFAQEAQQNRLSALGTLAQGAMQQGTAGTAASLGAGSGYSNLASLNQALQQMGISNQLQNQAGMGQVLGTLFGGGFNPLSLGMPGASSSFNLPNTLMNDSILGALSSGAS